MTSTDRSNLTDTDHVSEPKSASPGPSGENSSATTDIKPIRDLPPHFRRQGGPPPVIGVPVTGPMTEERVPLGHYFITV